MCHPSSHLQAQKLNAGKVWDTAKHMMNLREDKLGTTNNIAVLLCTEIKH